MKVKIQTSKGEVEGRGSRGEGRRSKVVPPSLKLWRTGSRSSFAEATADGGSVLLRGSYGGRGEELAMGERELRRTRMSARRGFTLIEILITVGLLSFIVIGLLAMFTQVQRAFRSSMTQTDVLESGRVLTDMLARDLEQMKPARLPYYRYGTTTNFLVEISPRFNRAGGNPALKQGLPATQAAAPGIQMQRTNLIQDFFFLSQVNQDWYGTGYAVLPSQVNSGVGTLYRFSEHIPLSDGTNSVTTAYALFRYAAAAAWLNILTNLPVTNVLVDPGQALPGPLSGAYPVYGIATVSRIADGVAHLRVRPFAANGFPIVGYDKEDSYYATDPLYQTNAFYRTNAFTFSTAYNAPVYSTVHQAAVTNAYNHEADPDYFGGWYFWSNAVPAYVEVEVGVLEQQTLKKYQALLPGPLQNAYLSNSAAQVHLFRQRVPVRAVDPTVYQ